MDGGAVEHEPHKKLAHIFLASVVEQIGDGLWHDGLIGNDHVVENLLKRKLHLRIS